jgi:hypothetical protein
MVCPTLLGIETGRMERLMRMIPNEGLEVWDDTN